VPAARSHVEHCHRPGDPVLVDLFVRRGDAESCCGRGGAPESSGDRRRRVLPRQRPHYTGRAHVDEMFAAEFSELVGQPIATVFTAHNVSRLYTYIKLELYVAGLPAGVAGDLAAATQQLALNSLQRGAAQVTVQMWSQPHALICEVVDDTVIDDVLLGRRVPVEDKHDGLWHANQLCDLVQMRSSSAGTTVRLHAWK
jgi:hypothetical protein